MSKVKEYAGMTKDKLMIYTFIALLILVGVSYLTFGITSLIISAITVLVAIGVDFLISKTAVDSQLNIMSAAVFGLIVALSYTLGLPTMGMGADASYPISVTMQGAGLYIFPALISLVGMVLFKKLQGMGGRKYVNPAAAAKLLVLVFVLSVALMPTEHVDMFPRLTSSLSLNTVAPNQPLPFGLALQQCYGDDYNAFKSYDPLEFNVVSQNEMLYTMLILKYHGWVGGVSSIAVLAVGIGLFLICRRYIKWRITAAYLLSVALFAFALSFVYADGDPIVRAVFHLFIGSSIFLAFFMATDPATTPLTYLGQVIFGVGLGVLTVLIQTYMGFFGGSILALVIMNCTSPMLDKVGKLKPTPTKAVPKLPKAKQFATVKVTQCIRCGACMRSCCHKLSPILVKQAFDKGNLEAARKLQANLCEGCGHCSFVCPARIDLKGTMLRAKSALRTKQ